MTRFDKLSSLVAVALVVWLSTAINAATLHTDTFDAGATLNWSSNGVILSGQTDGGPMGNGDGFLQVQSFSNLAVHNVDSLWTGNLSAIVAAAITVDLMNAQGSEPLAIRVVLFGPEHEDNRWTSLQSAPIPADGVWRNVSFSLAEADLSFVLGSGTYAQMMADVVKVMLRHDPGEANSGGTQVSATMGIDNVRLIGPPLPGDFNGDGHVNIADYEIWANAYGTTGDAAADGNGDGVVNAADYVFWRNRVVDEGTTGNTPPSAIPEPSAVVLLTLMFAAACCWRGGRHRSIRHWIRRTRWLSVSPT